MKIFTRKYLYRISKQGALNFMGEHPRLMVFIAGIGISFVFASLGRIMFHDVLALSAPSFTSTPVDHIAKVAVYSVPGPHIENVFMVSCSGCGDGSGIYPSENFPFDKFPFDKFPLDSAPPLKKIG
jgi:hypothetical protein